MGLVRVEQSVTGAAPSFSYAGVGWTQSVAHAAASGGTYAQTTTVGNSVTINVPAGKSGALVLVDIAAGVLVVDVAVDGGAPVRRTVGFAAATVATPYYWWQAALPPIAFSSTTTHTIVITLVSGALLTDAVELYDTATARGTGTIIGYGHSIVYGYNSLTLGQWPLPFVNEVARRLGMTATNQGVSGETVANGPNSASNPQFYDAPTPPSTGWIRASAGTAGIWHLARPEIALLMHTRNDLPYAILYDAPPPGNPANGASSAAQVQVLTTGGTTLSGAFTIFDGAAQSGMSVLSNQATLQSSLDAAGIGYTVALSASSMSVAGSTATFTSKTAGARPQNITINTTSPYALTPSNGITVGAPNPAGRNVSPAGMGYALARVLHRLREMLWRMQLNSVGTLVVVCGQMPDAQEAAATIFAWNLAVQQMCAEPTMKNVLYVDLYAQMNALSTAFTDGVHPSQEGHHLIAEAVVGAIRNARAQTMGRAH